MLKVSHLNKSYESGGNIYPVLKDVSFEIEKRRICGRYGSFRRGKPPCSTVFPASSQRDSGSVILGGFRYFKPERRGNCKGSE